MDRDEADVTDLPAVALRVLGSLLEKERTVPASYPMTLNAVRTACNQSSGRDPIMDLDEPAVQAALDDLRARGLTRVVHASHGARVLKYRQVLDEVLQLEDGERAALTLLLLRGPQTPGEVRSRSERLHGFADLDEVETALTALADRSELLVVELDRRPGQKEQRWAHLLGGSGVEAPAEASNESSPQSIAGGAVSAGAAASEAVLASGTEARDASVVAGYDAVAADYAMALSGELDAKPFDRWLLERVAIRAQDGPVADVGCGPGHIGFHLAAAGAEVTGFDLSPSMVDEARRRYPELSFAVADLFHLPPPSSPANGEGWAAVCAWYSLVHLAGSELAPAVAALTGALSPGGTLAFALHLGSEVRHMTEWWARPIDLNFVLHDRSAVLDAVAAADVVDIEWYVRAPYAGAEVETERMYVLARRAEPAPG